MLHGVTKSWTRLSNFTFTISSEGPQAQKDKLPVIQVPNIFPEWGESESLSLVSDSLWPHGLCSSWNSPGQNTGVGSLSLLQGIFPTQGSNPGLPYCQWRWAFYQLSHEGSPRILEWVAIPSTGDLPNPGIEQGILHCRQILYQLSYQGSPTQCCMPIIFQ